jgi:NACalpha-BTF3-like transcription factor
MTGQSKPIVDTDDGPVVTHSEREIELIELVASVCGVTPQIACIALEASEFDDSEAIELISMGQEIAPKGRTNKSEQDSIVDRENSVMECVGVDRETAQAALYENDDDTVYACDALTNGSWNPTPLNDTHIPTSTTGCPAESVEPDKVKIFLHAARTECDFRMVYLVLVKTQSIYVLLRSARLSMLITTTEVSIAMTGIYNYEVSAVFYTIRLIKSNKERQVPEIGLRPLDPSERARFEPRKPVMHSV